MLSATLDEPPRPVRIQGRDPDLPVARGQRRHRVRRVDPVQVAPSGALRREHPAAVREPFQECWLQVVGLDRRPSDPAIVVVVGDHAHVSGADVQFGKPHVLVVLTDELDQSATPVGAPVRSVGHGVLVARLRELDPGDFDGVGVHRGIHRYDPEHDDIARLAGLGACVVYRRVTRRVHVVDVLRRRSVLRSCPRAERHVAPVG